MSAWVPRIGLAAAVAALLCPATALAAPTRSGELTGIGARYDWAGGPVSGTDVVGGLQSTLPCARLVSECEDTLVHADAGGLLTFSIDKPSSTTVDIDLVVYQSDASGSQGTLLKSSTGPTGTESVAIDGGPGYYLVRVEGVTAVAGRYQGHAKLDAAPAVAASPATGPPASDAPPKAFISAAIRDRSGRVRAIRGTTADDGRVARVDVGIVRVRGRRCAALTATGAFTAMPVCGPPPLLRARGAVAWTFTPKRPLAPSTYIVYALATDAQGAQEPGFGPDNRMRLTF